MYRCDFNKPCRLFRESKHNQHLCAMRVKIKEEQMNISEKLFHKVLAIKEARNIKIHLKFNILICSYLHLDSGHMSKKTFEINLYEFAYLCKYWAYEKKNICIKSFMHDNISIADISGEDILNKRFIQNSESEAIIDACEWIAKQE